MVKACGKIRTDCSKQTVSTDIGDDRKQTVHEDEVDLIISFDLIFIAVAGVIMSEDERPKKK